MTITILNFRLGQEGSHRDKLRRLVDAIPEGWQVVRGRLTAPNDLRDQQRTINARLSIGSEVKWLSPDIFNPGEEEQHRALTAAAMEPGKFPSLVTFDQIELRGGFSMIDLREIILRYWRDLGYGGYVRFFNRVGPEFFDWDASCMLWLPMRGQEEDSSNSASVMIEHDTDAGGVDAIEPILVTCRELELPRAAC